MVDLFQLLYDTTAIVAYLVLPVAIFAALFLLAWERGLEGDLVGFGKRTFLLLLVGGVIGYLANLPFFTWNGSVLMVNVGGALLPVAVSLVVLDQRILPGRTRELALFLGMLTLAVSATLVALVELPTRLGLVGFLACFALSGALLVALRRRAVPAPRLGSTVDAVAPFVLVALGIWGTYLTTAVVPEVGIVSTFPDYLVAPLLIALAAVGLRWPRRDAPALAFAASTLGVLIGADILHQPQLFQAPAFLGSIGGAGPLDLVFLSGPFALGVALVVDVLLRRTTGPSAHGAEKAPSARPFGPVRGSEARFYEGLHAYSEGRYAEVAPAVVRTLDRDLAETRRALGLPEAPAATGLEPLPVHPFLSADLANLRQVAQEPPGTTVREDARRALVTGFLVQRGFLGLLGRRLALVGDRVKAFLVDLLVAFLPSIPALYLILRLLHLDVNSVTASPYTSIGYLAAISWIGAWPFLIYALLEWRYGVTPGKRLLDLVVVGPDGGRPSMLSALARNVPKLLPLAALSLTLGIGLPFAFQTTPISVGASVALVIIGAGVFISGLIGLVSVWAMRVSPRRQRLGDVLGSSMVWTRTPPHVPGILMAAGSPTVSPPAAPWPPREAPAAPPSPLGGPMGPPPLQPW